MAVDVTTTSLGLTCARIIPNSYWPMQWQKLKCMSINCGPESTIYPNSYQNFLFLSLNEQLVKHKSPAFHNVHLPPTSPPHLQIDSKPTHNTKLRSLLKPHFFTFLTHLPYLTLSISPPRVVTLASKFDSKLLQSESFEWEPE